MPRRAWCTLASLLAVGLALDASSVSARDIHARHPACLCVPHLRAHVAAARPRYVRVERRHARSRTGWRPVIPPFDQAEAEAYVHEIAPYRTYPFYPLIPAVQPQPYVFGW